MKILLPYLLLTAFTLAACSASPAHDIGNDKENLRALLKGLVASQDAPNEDDVNTLLKELAASQDDTSDDGEDDNDDDMTQIQTVFDVLDQVEEEQAKAMQDDVDDDDNAESQGWWSIFGKLASRYFGKYMRRYVSRYAKRHLTRYGRRIITRVGKNYIRRKYCSEKQAMLQEMDDESGDDDNDTTFAELQSLLHAIKELKAAKIMEKNTADAERVFSRLWKKARKRYC